MEVKQAFKLDIYLVRSITNDVFVCAFREFKYFLDLILSDAQASLVVDEFVHDEVGTHVRVLKLHFDHCRAHEHVPHTLQWEVVREFDQIKVIKRD